MKRRKHAALVQTILIVGFLGVFSWIATQAFNPDISAEMPVNFDVGKVGSVLLEKIGDLIKAFLSPERRSGAVIFQ